VTIIALAGARGGPGVTTASLLLAAALPGGVLIEADPSGGVLAARYELGREPGLTTYLAEVRSAGPGGVDWRAHAQSAGGVPTIVGPDRPEAAYALWAQAGDRAGLAVRSMGTTVVADLGRLGSLVPLGGCIDLVLLVVRGTREQLVTASHRVTALRGAASQVGAVVIGSGAYGPEEVRDALGVDVVASLPEDAAAATAFEGTGGSARGLARSRLVRSSHELASTAWSAIETPDVVGVGR
jgi:hypothetical protein